MPNYSSFILVTALPPDGYQMGRTVTLRQDGTDTPYIWARREGVNQWVELPERPDVVTQDEFDVFTTILYADPRWTNPRPSAIPFVLPTRLVTAAYSIQQGADYLIACDMTAGPYQVTLPASPADGERYEVSKVRGTGVLKVGRNGNPVDGHNVDPSVAANHTATFRFVAGFGWVSTESDSAV